MKLVLLMFDTRLTRKAAFIGGKKTAAARLVETAKSSGHNLASRFHFRNPTIGDQNDLLHPSNEEIFLELVFLWLVRLVTRP